ncbi:MAG: T9SS type A sorting domain-containing protein [Saprospiraceae bacterium]|nr:T9SS type A sorting domain-containing protein [Saprospiraceae bacterium]
MIFNKDAKIMENGDDLNPGFVQQGNWCENGYPGGNQSHFFLEDPNDTYRLWLFHVSASESANYPLPTYLRTSKIDLRLNNGLGKVIEKNTKIVIDSLIAYGELAATRHSNTIDWWIISPTGRSDSLYRTFLLTTTGLKGPFEQRIGKSIDQLNSGGGAFKFNSQGTKLARYGYNQGVFLYDFDRETGKLSNFVELDTSRYEALGGAEFSASGKYLYVSTRYELFQYDMEASDIRRSIIRIDSLDGFQSNVSGQTVTFGSLQLGPDCRIYVVPTTSVDYFGVIHYPENSGRTCDFRQHSLKLPFPNQLTRIYYPQYRTGSLQLCDSTIRAANTSGVIDYQTYLNTLSVFPNPSSDQIDISLLGSLYFDSKIHIIDQNGRLVREELLFAGSTQKNINIENLQLGLYTIKLSDKTGIIGLQRFVKI